MACRLMIIDPLQLRFRAYILGFKVQGLGGLGSLVGLGLRVRGSGMLTYIIDISASAAYNPSLLFALWMEFQAI